MSCPDPCACNSLAVITLFTTSSAHISFLLLQWRFSCFFFFLVFVRVYSRALSTVRCLEPRYQPAFSSSTRTTAFTKQSAGRDCDPAVCEPAGRSAGGEHRGQKTNQKVDNLINSSFRTRSSACLSHAGGSTVRGHQQRGVRRKAPPGAASGERSHDRML